MATFNTNGLDALILDMDEISSLDNDTAASMLDAGGEIIRKAHMQQIKQDFTSRTGHLGESPTVYRKSSQQRYVLIYPSGTHHTYKSRSSTSGGQKKASNQEVGFVHEFGGHGNAASNWMRRANEEHVEEAVNAEYAVFDAWHKTHNL